MDTILYERQGPTLSGSIARTVVETNGTIYSVTDYVDENIVFHHRLTGNEIAMLFILLSEQVTPFILEVSLEAAQTRLNTFRQKQDNLNPAFADILNTFTKIGA